MADRPGALGSVAARIGAVGGDVTGIDIFEHGGGTVIDELTIDLPNEDRISQLLESLKELEYVDVEDIRAVVAGLPVSARKTAEKPFRSARKCSRRALIGANDALTERRQNWNCGAGGGGDIFQ